MVPPPPPQSQSCTAVSDVTDIPETKNIRKNIFSLKLANNKNIQPRFEKQYSYLKRECSCLSQLKEELCHSGEMF